MKARDLIERGGTLMGPLLGVLPAAALDIDSQRTGLGDRL